MMRPGNVQPGANRNRTWFKAGDPDTMLVDGHCATCRGAIPSRSCEASWIAVVRVYNGASCIYICVNGTMCEPLFAQLPGDSWIRLFENPKRAAEHQRDIPARPLRGCDLTIAYLYITCLSPKWAGPSHCSNNGSHKVSITQ